MIAVLAATLGACSLTPDYTRPEAPVADQYPAATPADLEAARRAVDIGWREFFQDPRLQALIAQALEHNRDLRAAALNVEAARAAYRIERADQLPRLDVDGSATRSRTPGGQIPGGGAQLGPRYQTQYQVGLGIAAFELDFFGRVRSLSDAALARYLASEEAERAARITLVAEVARAYLAERAAAEQLDLAGRTLASRRDSYDLARQRFEAGASSALDLRQAETLVEAARISLAVQARQRAQANNALTLLVGQPLTDLPAPTDLSAQRLVSDIPAGLPSALLTQRPDILAAEQQLLAANAEIGAARAAFFPRISLTGNVGTASDELSDLFGNGSGVWSFGPRISLPIFTGGANRAGLDLAQVRRSQAVVEYERTIQRAFREVADALVARATLDDQVAAQERLRQAQAARLELAEQRYQAGVSSYLDVLDAQRELFDAEQALVQARQLRLANSVDLYRALGGGLREESATIPTGGAPSR